MFKICVADNHPVIYQGIKSSLKDSVDFDVIGHVTSLDDLHEFLDNKVVHLVVLDVELNGLSSIRDVKILVKEFSSTKFFIFTNVSEILYANNAFKVGARGYLEKKASLKEFSNAIKSVSLGNIFKSEAMKKTSKTNTKNTERFHKKLSTREIEVLKYLNDGKKNKEIAEILKLDEKTISTYKLRLSHKLEVSNLIDLINKAKTLGLV